MRWSAKCARYDRVCADPKLRRDQPQDRQPPIRARSATACDAPCLRVKAVSSYYSTSSSTIATARLGSVGQMGDPAVHRTDTARRAFDW